MIYRKRDLDLRLAAKAFGQAGYWMLYFLIAGVWERTDAFIVVSIIGSISRLFSDSLSVHLTLLLSQQMDFTPHIVFSLTDKIRVTLLFRTLD
jgi:hypothetical protein